MSSNESSGAKQPEFGTVDYGRQLASESPVHVNVVQDIIMTTEDRLKLKLQAHAACIEQRGAWIAPLGIGVTILAVFVASDFKDAFGVPKDTWRALFMFCLLACSIWLVKACYRALTAKGSLESLIKDLKGSMHAQQTTGVGANPVARVSGSQVETTTLNASLQPAPNLQEIVQSLAAFHKRFSELAKKKES